MLAITGIYIKRFYAFSNLDTEQVLITKIEKFNRPILIVGREHCYECSRDLPITQIDEVKKAAMLMDDLAPFEGVKFFIIEPLSRDSSRIYFYIINKEIYNKLCKQSWLLFPESLLVHQTIAKQLNTNNITAKLAEREIKAFKTSDGFKSVVIDNTQIEVNDFASFSAGKIEGTQTFTSRDYAQLLVATIFKLPSYCYQQAFSKNRLVNLLKTIPFKFITVTCSLTFIIYLGLSSAWLSYQQSSLSDEISQQKNSLEKVFILQKNINKALSVQKQLSNLKDLNRVSSNIWPVLLELVNNDTELLMVNYVNGEYTVRMKVEKSTSMLKLLSENKLITTPIMASPVVKYLGKEIMTIRFSLRPRIPKMTKNNAADRKNKVVEHVSTS